MVKKTDPAYILGNSLLERFQHTIDGAGQWTEKENGTILASNANINLVINTLLDASRDSGHVVLTMCIAAGCPKLEC